MGKKSNAGKGSLAAYKSNNSFGKNKVRKLQTHLKKHPEDAVAAATLSAVSRSIATSPRWGHKRVGNLNASQRLQDQTVSKVQSGLRQLSFLSRHDNVEMVDGKYTSDQIKERAARKAA